MGKKNYFLEMLLESAINGLSMAAKALFKQDIVPGLEKRIEEQTKDIRGEI